MVRLQNGNENQYCFRPSLCTYKLNWVRETPEDCEMNELTLLSRHMIRNSSPDGPRPTTLPLGHGRLPTLLNIYE